MVGVSTDSVFAHKGFAKSFGGLSFPLLSDRWPYARTAEDYGVFPAARHGFGGVNDRAVFIVGRDGRIAWLKVYDLGETPDVGEILSELRRL